MTGFHRLLRDGERPADALALAERALASSDTASLAGDGGASAERAIGGIAPQRPPSQPPRLDTDMRHPFFWAPFVLYGDSE
jgi:CHAT domain-containing protein